MQKNLLMNNLLTDKQPLLTVLYTLKFKITDYICTQQTTHLYIIIMHNIPFIISIGLLNCLCFLSIILYVRNIKFKRIIKTQFEEIKRLNIEYQKLHSKPSFYICSDQIKLNEKEIKDLLRHKPFLESSWDRIEDFINNTQNMFVDRITYSYPNLTQEDIHIILLIRLHFTNKEIASLYNIQLSSLNTKRYRLKKK